MSSVAIRYETIHTFLFAETPIELWKILCKRAVHTREIRFNYNLLKLKPIYDYISSTPISHIPKSTEDWFRYTKDLSKGATPAESFITYLATVSFVYEKFGRPLRWSGLIFYATRLAIYETLFMRKYEESGNVISECSICYKDTINFIVPCGHPVCSSCQPRLYIKKCPLCRGPIHCDMYTQILDLFDVTLLYCPSHRDSYFSMNNFLKFPECICVDCTDVIKK